MVRSRLQDLGMAKLRLPLETPPSSPHVPVFVSSNLKKAYRIIVIFGEAAQDLGILAHRVLGGPGGVNKGSMVSVVRAIQAQMPKTGIIIANPGQLWWWPEGQRGLTPTLRFAIPMKSAVHLGREYDASMNAIPGNETVRRHVRSVFEEVVGKLCRRDVELDVIAMTDVADEVERFLDDENNWKIWGGRMGSLALLGNLYSVDEMKCQGFQDFLKDVSDICLCLLVNGSADNRQRGRAWISDMDPQNIPLVNPEGNFRRVGVGCPVLSAGPDANIAELLLIHTHRAVLDWMHEVSYTENYRNPFFNIVVADPDPHRDAHYWGSEDTEGNDEATDEAANGKGAPPESQSGIIKNDEATLKKDRDTLKDTSAALEVEMQVVETDAQAPEAAAASEAQADTIKEGELTVKQDTDTRGDALEANETKMQALKTEHQALSAELEASSETLANNRDLTADNGRWINRQQKGINTDENHDDAGKTTDVVKTNEDSKPKTDDDNSAVKSQLPGLPALKRTFTGSTLASPTLGDQETPPLIENGDNSLIVAADATAAKKKEEEERANIDHMRREVLAALEQAESMATLALEKGPGAGIDSDDDEE